jgi:hypothetical protein
MKFMKDANQVADSLKKLQGQLLEKTYLAFDPDKPFATCSPEYGPDEWEGNWIGVYVLWEKEDDYVRQRSPVYVGEGIIGKRIWDSHQTRKNWRHAQILTHELISGGTLQQTRWRKLLERFLIVTLEPLDNVG